MINHPNNCANDPNDKTIHQNSPNTSHDDPSGSKVPHDGQNDVNNGCHDPNDMKDDLNDNGMLCPNDAPEDPFADETLMDLIRTKLDPNDRDGNPNDAAATGGKDLESAADKLQNPENDSTDIDGNPDIKVWF